MRRRSGRRLICPNSPARGQTCVYSHASDQQLHAKGRHVSTRHHRRTQLVLRTRYERLRSQDHCARGSTIPGDHDDTYAHDTERTTASPSPSAVRSRPPRGQTDAWTHHGDSLDDPYHPRGTDARFRAIDPTTGQVVAMRIFRSKPVDENDDLISGHDCAFNDCYSRDYSYRTPHMGREFDICQARRILRYRLQHHGRICMVPLLDKDADCYDSAPTFSAGQLLLLYAGMP